MNGAHPAGILRWLADRGIVLAAEGASLRVRSRAPLTPAVRDRIRANKSDLLGHLKGTGAVACPVPGAAPRTGYRLVADAAGLSAAETAVGTASQVGLDLETIGLSHARDRVRLLSLATPTGTFLVDLFRLEPAPLWLPLAAVEVVRQNLGFDLPFLMRLGFVPGRVRDTMLASQVLHSGDRGIGHSLKELAHLGVELDKEQQTADWSGPLTAAHLGYAARDAEVPLALWEKLAPRSRART